MSLSDILAYIYQVLNFPLFTVKSATVTVSSILMFFIVMAGFLLLSKIFLKILLTKLLSQLKIDHGTRYNLLRIAHYIVLVIGSIVSFQFIGIDLSGLIVIFGFLSVGIGFGLQNIASNFISGLIILLERPIKVGDRVTVGEIDGDVVEINIRSTTVRSEINCAIVRKFREHKVEIPYPQRDLHIRSPLPVPHSSIIQHNQGSE